MKKFFILPLLLFGFATVSLRAGQEVYKQVAPPPPPLWGTGFYGALDAGANIYQNRGDSQTFTDDNPNSPFFGSNLIVDPKNDVGFFGGLKLGYVFGTGIVRPAVEGDFFYNGFRGGADFTLNEAFTACPDCPTVLTTRKANVTTWINSGAFMANFILRFAPGNQKFQPYAGAGVGVYYAESAGFEFQGQRENFSGSGGRSHADLAWQIIAGSDYYWTPKFSTFIEYHYLDYTSSQIDTRQSRDLGQHLIGAGVRIHF